MAEVGRGSSLWLSGGLAGIRIQLVPFQHTFGEAMSSSPWGGALGQGDVDVAARAGLRTKSPGFRVGSRGMDEGALDDGPDHG